MNRGIEIDDQRAARSTMPHSSTDDKPLRSKGVDSMATVVLNHLVVQHSPTQPLGSISPISQTSSLNSEDLSTVGTRSNTIFFTKFSTKHEGKLKVLAELDELLRTTRRKLHPVSVKIGKVAIGKGSKQDSQGIQPLEKATRPQPRKELSKEPRKEPKKKKTLPREIVPVKTVAPRRATTSKKRPIEGEENAGEAPKRVRLANAPQSEFQTVLRKFGKFIPPPVPPPPPPPSVPPPPPPPPSPSPPRAPPHVVQFQPKEYNENTHRYSKGHRGPWVPLNEADLVGPVFTWSVQDRAGCACRGLRVCGFCTRKHAPLLERELFS
ncbi:hypothetical protein EDC01DRAFT_759999 [Geopyxis carbonaria]|nr:hypothetical protein EDC01DRAFT_759999 [Geopyxis carbonaria]